MSCHSLVTFNFPHTLFSMTFFALSAWSVPYRRRAVRLGIFCWCSAFCEVLILRRSLASCGTSLRRSCSWSPLLQPAGLASFRRFLAMSPSLALAFTGLIFRNFVRRLNLRSIRFLAPFVFVRWRSSGGTFTLSGSCSASLYLACLFCHSSSSFLLRFSSFSYSCSFEKRS